MSGRQIFKRPRASDRAGRVSATRRQEIAEMDEAFKRLIAAASKAGKCIEAPYPEDPTLDAVESALRAEAEALDRSTNWTDEALWGFLGEPGLESHETVADRAAKIVKRAQMRLKAAQKSGYSLRRLLGGNPWPTVRAETTYAFANRWARRIGFQAPDPCDGDEGDMSGYLQRGFTDGGGI